MSQSPTIDKRDCGVCSKIIRENNIKIQVKRNQEVRIRGETLTLKNLV